MSASGRKGEKGAGRWETAEANPPAQIFLIGFDFHNYRAIMALLRLGLVGVKGRRHGGCTDSCTAHPHAVRGLSAEREREKERERERG